MGQNEREKGCRVGRVASNTEKQGIDLGLNVYSEAKYIGPNPPMGTHQYYFRIYALSVPSLDLVKPTRANLMEKVKDNVLAYGELVGTFKK